MRGRVTDARARQVERAGVVNARLDLDGLKHYCRLGADPRALLVEAAAKQALSPRACHRISKVARTLADLDILRRSRKSLPKAACFAEHSDSNREFES